MTRAEPVPTVSVVLPTHNRASVLPRAMASVLDQSYADLELIIVDDASTDDTEQIVRSFDDPRIRFVRHERNRGAPAARNRGVRESRGRFIAFQDSDDDWLPGKLEKQMAALKASEGREVVYCAFIRSGGDGQRRVPDAQGPIEDGDILPRLLFENTVSTQTLLMTRERFEEIGGFDETLGRFQDWELAIRLATVARFHLVNEPLVTVHETAGSISSDDAAGAAAFRRILDKHRHLYRQHPDALSYALASLGHLECLAGDLAEGRRHLRQSLRMTPFARKTWIPLILSYLGSTAYRLAAATGGTLARAPMREAVPGGGNQ